MLSLYGKSLNFLLKKKLIIDHFFFNTLTFLELRFSTIALRVFFFFNLLSVIKEINLGNIMVNNKKKHKNFLVPVNSVVQYCNIASKKVILSSLTYLNIINLRG
jgi:hypothetical protein